MTKYNVNHIEDKDVRAFVHGAVNLYCDQSGALTSIEFDKRRQYVNSTLDVVWAYLRTKDGLDGRCSDMQCDVAMRAFALFKPIVDGGVCEFCGGPNLAHMAGPCAQQRFALQSR